MNLETVNELIASLESAGELSIREQKFLKLAKAYHQLAADRDAVVAENAALKSAIDHTIEWIESTNGDPCDVVIIKGIETPATDRIVAGIKADGVEEFAAKLRIPGDDQFFDALAKGVALAADDFAKQLREGAGK
ncbi:hypothetical protein [Klebsiella quasipneumoniae]|uniref:hypothetical protein n=1 Tax=Klebsiella quasipneumoniae TaxID=1463165 RepID=UPI00164A3995|nr:hypothetical protein [Klebsiella quasipneumoniae]HDT5203337.1 hypothetical protein [Klebsiella quasipneumoniae subsp. similipneumoniae]MBC4639652.1 hypothetical protein [Klebsiella quasipneumoniae]MBC4691264.1 hypothetical protein [Klebsiella quasipneumoniae]MBC4718481.1 hypothetical protein [Klebsiella quasipneumoniae]MDL4000318.1 hypothetical protein [Klebsiella quasipneumoniae]